jgi:hypothetical protein
MPIADQPGPHTFFESARSDRKTGFWTNERARTQSAGGFGSEGYLEGYLVMTPKAFLVGGDWVSSTPYTHEPVGSYFQAAPEQVEQSR